MSIEILLRPPSVVIRNVESARRFYQPPLKTRRMNIKPGIKHDMGA